MPKIQQLYHMQFFFLLTKYSTELYFNSNSICHFNLWSELEHTHADTGRNYSLPQWTNKKRIISFYISTFISLNHFRNIIIIALFTENIYSPHTLILGAPVYRCSFAFYFWGWHVVPQQKLPSYITNREINLKGLLACLFSTPIPNTLAL